MHWKYPAGVAVFVLAFGGAWAFKAWWTAPPEDPIAALEAAARSGELELPPPPAPVAPDVEAPEVPPAAARPPTAPQPEGTSAEQLSEVLDAEADDDEPRGAPRSLADLHALEEVEQPETDLRVPRTPGAVEDVLEDLRPELEDCLEDALPAGVAPVPTPVELELRPTPTGDRSQLDVAAEPLGVDPMTAVPCLTEVLRSVPFEMAPETEAWTFDAFSGE